ncbi:peptide-methionine (S)-S-oxide reductase MsrA [Alkalicoccus halolimnae]|uniref:Peptide methionine sulfoxide reductase MsrA n=1 Tax=Alkalicoccus halolimnae TaxID=1667239 RepID=A0A5C7F963_9BACI|nr:peptide-methionine (S)-S-oxide reductase MsrA [Alkalicoccus halolimnae]TXF87202.1 peptide-methionine (S)-S-oxide reductase MsrA [Alkalicoccus halolimnae]
MKKIIIALMTIIVSISAIIFVPIIYDYFTSRSYGSEPVEENESDFLETATFAGGCFWCMEPPFEDIEGVDKAVSGYTGGEQVNPAYEEVAAGETNHVEAVQITYDPDLISYEELLEVFWRQIDPTDDEGQFVDRGEQYASAVFYHDESQKEAAEASKQKLEDSGRFEEPIVTEIKSALTFYVAEDYHQDFYKENPVRYEFYRSNSGRDEFLEEYWGEEEYEVESDPDEVPSWREYEQESEEELRERLSEEEFEVTQNDATEEAYNNEYWDNEQEGIYVDIVSKEPLFSSTHQYESGTGWPSFWEVISEEYIVEEADWGLLGRRTEVRSKYADSHLGHVFNDGPDPTGLRYCLNSAALDFIPVEDMEAEGYEDFLYLFEEE